jgi:hypothetical protein
MPEPAFARLALGGALVIVFADANAAADASANVFPRLGFMPEPAFASGSTRFNCRP